MTKEKEGNKTIIIAEHRLFWLTDLCDRAVYMDNGQVGFDVSMAELTSWPQTKLQELGLRSLTLTNIQHSSNTHPTTTADAQSIHFKDFKYTYQTRQALQIDSLSVDAGSTVAIIGNNGAGKSTFAQCLCGLQKGFKGSIAFNNKVYDKKKLLDVTYLVMQDVNHQLFCDSVLEEVTLGMKSINMSRVNEVLEVLDLSALVNEEPMSLSGGQKQRVALASALLSDKEILVLDEPTSGLDYRHMIQTSSYINKLGASKTVFIITHDPELIVNCAIHALLMDNGRVKYLKQLDKQGQAEVQQFFLSSLQRTRKDVTQLKEEAQRSTASWILEFAGEKRINYIASIILALCGAICHMIPFFLMARVVQMLIGGETSFAAYTPLMLSMILAWAMRVLFHAVSTSFSHIATYNVLGNIRRRGLAKLERMPLGDVDAYGSGNLKNILCERIDSFEPTLAHVVPEMSGNLSVVVFTLIYLFTVNWKMAFASLITFPIGMICMSMMMIGYEKYYNRTIKATKELNNAAVEYIGGIEVVKVFGKSKNSYQKFVAAAKEGAASYVDWMRVSNKYFNAGLIITPATLVSVLPIGGIMVMHGTLSVEDFILIVILAMGLITPVITCVSYNDELNKLNTIIGEVTNLLVADEMMGPDTSLDLPTTNDIELRDVRFGYSDTEVLHGINAAFKAGSVNAIVGPSGGGKSTIAKLIASYWDAQSGEICLGGVNVCDLSRSDFYSRVAYVSQENFLFDCSIKDNIRLGNQNASDEDVITVAKECGCYDFIMSLENGFDTIVGDGGNHLSGGEKQRICIARAMLKDAPIVILDEATAYTDPENEALIQSSVAKLVAGKTLIVIAHRLSTIVDADQIVVINHGEVVDSGTHVQLLNQCPLYESMWKAHIESKDSVVGSVA